MIFWFVYCLIYLLLVVSTWCYQLVNGVDKIFTTMAFWLVWPVTIIVIILNVEGGNRTLRSILLMED